MRTPSRLRALEKRFVKERAQLAVHQFAACLLTRWDQFMAAEMDAIAILRKLRIDPNSIDTWPKAIRYINRCIKEDRPPDYRALITALAPWTVNRR